RQSQSPPPQSPPKDRHPQSTGSAPPPREYRQSTSHASDDPAQSPPDLPRRAPISLQCSSDCPPLEHPARPRSCTTVPPRFFPCNSRERSASLRAPTPPARLSLPAPR